MDKPTRYDDGDTGDSRVIFNDIG